MKRTEEEKLNEMLTLLEQRGRDARRQDQLSDVIDRLAEAETEARPGRRRTWLWVAPSAAAACLLLWLGWRALTPNPELNGTEHNVAVLPTPSATSESETVPEATTEAPQPAAQPTHREQQTAPALHRSTPLQEVAENRSVASQPTAAEGSLPTPATLESQPVAPSQPVDEGLPEPAFPSEPLQLAEAEVGPATEEGEVINCTHLVEYDEPAKRQRWSAVAQQVASIFSISRTDKVFCTDLLAQNSED